MKFEKCEDIMTRKYLAITALLLAPWSVNATVWTINSTSSVTPAGIQSMGAYSVGTTSTSTFSPATLAWYGSANGLGVLSGSETTSSFPDHAVDNSGRIEAVLFRFDGSTILDKLTVGWPDTTAYDSDISVIRYTGAVPATGPLTGAADISGKSISGLLSNSWEFVGSYNTVGDVAEDINPSNLSSSLWLISAYSSSWGSGKGDPSSQLNNSNDYFKLTQLVGTAGGSGGGGGGGVGSVPEPTSLLLLASGMLGWRMNRKSQTIAA
ncbi:exosortase-dependent surface protein XDP1 [Methylomonas methanica]|uniref:exosortase-dependent surface protein XDP1 n=1 Tax=Methylomonas methanica TaxID=421 RepID=UPI0009EDB880|nr:exosortase-dependent surface protein XDP1 [Methylomonas methanica]